MNHNAKNQNVNLISDKNILNSFNEKKLIQYIQNVINSKNYQTKLVNFIQNSISIENRKSMGQIYTPDEIGKIMAELIIIKPDMTVLDPACGIGVLLTNVYTQMKKISKTNDSKLYNTSILSNIWGVEINQFPAKIAQIFLNCLDNNLQYSTSNIIITDFLSMEPEINFNIHDQIENTKNPKKNHFPLQFDAIIANPPYIKQEKIPNKENLIKILPKLVQKRLEILHFLKKERNSMDIQEDLILLTAKTDYYGYFIWYSTFFLKQGGLSCFLVPNKWLDVKYGEKLKEFILSNYKIIAIISFSQNIFHNAQVSTIILLLQREMKKEQRKNNIVKFIYLLTQDVLVNLKDKVYSDISENVRQNLDEVQYIFQNNDKNIKCTIIKQLNLRYSEKWSLKYIHQSKIAQIIQKIPLISMDNYEITSVIGGIKTGANDFYFPSKKIIQKFGIETQFLIPGIKSGRNIPKSIIIETTDNFFLSYNPNLNKQKYSAISKYIKFGENIMKYHLRPSVKWKPWYSIPPEKQDSPDILFLRHIDKNFIAKWNKIHAVVADGVRGIKIHNPDHILFYLGVLNSTYFYWQAHILGRWEGQGDLQLLVYELKKFRIPDIRIISHTKMIQVEEIMKKMIHKSKENVHSDIFGKDHNLKKELDLAVLDCMDIIEYYDLLNEETKIFEQQRLTKAKNFD